MRKRNLAALAAVCCVVPQTGRTAGQSQALPAPSGLNVRIVGTANFQGRYTALIEDRATLSDSFYRVGDLLYGYKVADISGAGIRLEKSGKAFFLPLEGKSSSAAAKPGAASTAGATAPSRTTVASAKPVQANSYVSGVPTAASKSPAQQQQQRQVPSAYAVPAAASQQRPVASAQPQAARPLAQASQARPASLSAAESAAVARISTGAPSGAAPAANAQYPSHYLAAAQAPRATVSYANGRPVTAAVPTATAPRLSQPSTVTWEEISGPAKVATAPTSQLAAAAAARGLAPAGSVYPNTYVDGVAGYPTVRTSERSPDEQRILQAAMMPGGSKATRLPDYGRPLTAPTQVASAASAREAAPAQQRPGMMSYVTSPINSLFGGRGGSMVFPLQDYKKLSSGFGYRVHPIGGGTRMHKGLDLSASPGTRIFAAQSGVVTWSGWRGGYGYCIIVDHRNGFETLYGHCSKLIADTGDVVRKGEFIAEVGSTGASTGPHLHFEVHKGGEPIDPMPYLPGLN